MLKNSKAFSSFAVRDLDAARKFYSQTLGVDVSDVPGMRARIGVVAIASERELHGLLVHVPPTALARQSPNRSRQPRPGA